MPTTRIGAYQAVQTITADPGRLVLLLFDGAAGSLRQAIRGLEAGNVPQFANSLSRAHAIIAELSNTLDRDAGGELAENLGRLYDFMLHHLTLGGLEKNPTHLTRVLALLETLREGFEGIVERPA